VEKSSQRVLEKTNAVRKLVPTPWDREEFVRQMGISRGRPIVLKPVQATALSRLPCGLWLSLDDHDEIAYDAGSSDYHIDQTIFHEVGHMLLDHHSEGQAFGGLAEMLPNIDLNALRFVMTRSNFDDEQESEAELFADLLMSTAVSRFRQSNVMSDVWGRR
jgi:hypothetical protein